MGVEFVRMLTAAQRHQLVFNCPLCSLLRIGVVGVDIGISGFGSRSRLSGILPEHFGQFDASFRDGGTLGQMMDQPQLGAQLMQPAHQQCTANDRYRSADGRVNRGVDRGVVDRGSAGAVLCSQCDVLSGHEERCFACSPIKACAGQIRQSTGRGDHPLFKLQAVFRSRGGRQINRQSVMDLCCRGQCSNAAVDGCCAGYDIHEVAGSLFKVAVLASILILFITNNIVGVYTC